MVFDFFDRKIDKERKSTPTRIKKLALQRAGDKCERCGIRFDGFTPDYHHKNYNPNDNSLSNIEVLCPNCHRKETVNPTKIGEENWIFRIIILLLFIFLLGLILNPVFILLFIVGLYLFYKSIGKK